MPAAAAERPAPAARASVPNAPPRPVPNAESAAGAPRQRVLVVSHVLPFPAEAGQRQRVRLTLDALRARFHVTLLAAAPPGEAAALARALGDYCDDAIVLPTPGPRGRAGRLLRAARAAAYCARTGERASNHAVNRVLFPPRRVLPVVRAGRFDAVLFEYWHASDAAAAVRALGVPTVLDMHNVLWQARARQLAAARGLPAWARRWVVARYRRREERAWQHFDALVAINEAERAYAAPRARSGAPTWLAPMGVPLAQWPFDWRPTTPPRVAFYGGLGSAHNAAGAVRCARAVMPHVWRARPDAELWIVGSRPPAHVRALAGPRVRVTGFVEDAAAVLREATAVLCPWEGTYGFRSRLVEVMALGVPVCASPDAVYGMDLPHGRGLLLGDTDTALAGHVLRLIDDPAFARAQSAAARAQVEGRYGFDATYGYLAGALETWLAERTAGAGR